MNQLDEEQLSSLINLIDQTASQTLSYVEFRESAWSCFENIPGFETIQPNRAGMLIKQMWEMYMSKKEAARTPAGIQQADTVDRLSGTPTADLSKPFIQKAIADGKALIAEGKTKADAARAMYPQINNESKETIIAAFVEGATLTPKGAQTYWYNCRRKASKEKKTAE